MTHRIVPMIAGMGATGPTGGPITASATLAPLATPLRAWAWA